jgi:hypothetical protein
MRAEWSCKSKPCQAVSVSIFFPVFPNPSITPIPVTGQLSPSRNPATLSTLLAFRACCSKSVLSISTGVLRSTRENTLLSDSHQNTRNSLELCRKLPCCVWPINAKWDKWGQIGTIGQN